MHSGLWLKTTYLHCIRKANILMVDDMNIAEAKEEKVNQLIRDVKMSKNMNQGIYRGCSKKGNGCYDNCI